MALSVASIGRRDPAGSPLPTSIAGFGQGYQPTASNQAAALRSPAPVTASTPVNPMQQHAYGRAKSYEEGLASGTDEMITRELQRGRDELSIGLQKEGEGAIQRGADPSLFRSRMLEGGRRGLHELQGRLTDTALGRREGAVNALTGAAGAAAGEQRLTQLGTMSQRLAEDASLRETAETQARLDQAPYNRLLDTMRSVGQYRDSFAGPPGYTPPVPGALPGSAAFPVSGLPATPRIVRGVIGRG